jgi:hypothetical protein
MCRIVAALLALTLGTAGPALRAQVPRGRPSGTRALLARAESLQAQLAERDSLAERAVYQRRLARRFSAGDVTVLLAGTADEVVGTAVAARGWALLDTLGALPRGFAASRVVVDVFALGVDSVLRAEGLSGGERVPADFFPALDTVSGGFVVAMALARAYGAMLDPTWRSWAPAGLTLGWMEGRDGVAARHDLLAGETRVGGKCLEGEVRQCALWLGIDHEDHPFRVRYAPSELRRHLEGRMSRFGPSGATPRQCVNGSDEACIRFAESTRYVDPIPAPSAARASLLRAVRVLHGAAALRRALADTSGAVGLRLVRASGVSEDSLLAEWRGWLLTGGGRRRVTADVADSVPVAVFGALLLFAAARSGRWR